MGDILKVLFAASVAAGFTFCIAGLVVAALGWPFFIAGVFTGADERRRRCSRRCRRRRGGRSATVHLDIKKLGRFRTAGHRITGDRTGQSNNRGVGWEFVHVCIDDNSRVSFSQILPDEKAASATAFLKAALAYYKSLGVTVRRVMTDNGACYKSHAFRDLCRELGLKHVRTRPYTPKTNGKAERFIQTALREWAYAKAYPTSDHRAAELPIWLHRYNWHRPHGGISRLGLTEAIPPDRLVTSTRLKPASSSSRANASWGGKRRRRMDSTRYW